MINLILFIMLIICSISDIKEKKVYGSILLCLFIIIALYLLFNKHIGINNIVGLGFGLALSIIGKITKGKLGVGDGFMLSIIGFGIGFLNQLYIFLISLILIVIFSLFLIILKKINIKDSLPLAPFLLIGFIIKINLVWAGRS